MLEVNSKQSGEICSETWKKKRKSWWEVFAEKKEVLSLEWKSKWVMVYQ